MAGKNDILASAGVDLSDFDKGIAKLTSRLDAVEKAGSKTASGIEKVGKSTNALKNIQIFDHLNNALASIASGGGAAQRALGGMATNFALAKNDFSDASLSMGGLAKATGAAVDFMAKMPGKMGTVGVGLSTLSDIAAQATVANNNFANEMARGATSMEGMIQKSARLANLQQDEAARSVSDAGNLRSMADARNRIAGEYEKTVKKQIELDHSKSAGASQILKISLLELDAKQKIADLESSQTVNGVMSDAGRKIAKAGADEINSRLKLQTKEIWYQFAQQQDAVDLQTSAMRAQISGNTKLAALARSRAQYEGQIRDAIKQGNPGIAEALRLQQNLIELEIKAQQLLKTPEQKKQERDEQKKHDKAIGDANRRDKNEQKKNAPRESLLDEYTRKKLQDDADKKIKNEERIGNAGLPGFDKKGNPLPQGSVGKIYGERKGEDFVGKEADKAVKEFADRNALRLNPEGGGGVEAQKEFITQKLVVNGIFKNGP